MSKKSGGQGLSRSAVCQSQAQAFHEQKKQRQTEMINAKVKSSTAYYASALAINMT